MRIAVLGSGGGGCAVALDCAIHKHSVRLFDFDIFPDNIKRIQQQGGVYAEGFIEAFAPIEYAGHDIEEAVRHVDVVYVVGPAYSTRRFAEACRPYLRKAQVVVLCPGSCMGSIEFKNGAQLSLHDEDIIVAETSTLPYAVRIVEPGRVRVFLKLKAGVFVAAVPARSTHRVKEKIRDVYPAIASARDVLQYLLNNPGGVILSSKMRPRVLARRVAGSGRPNWAWHMRQTRDPGCSDRS